MSDVGARSSPGRVCGDVIYDFNDQIVEPVHAINAFEPRIMGIYSNSHRQQKGAIKTLPSESKQMWTSKMT